MNQSINYKPIDHLISFDTPAVNNKVIPVNETIPDQNKEKYNDLRNLLYYAYSDSSALEIIENLEVMEQTRINYKSRLPHFLQFLRETAHVYSNTLYMDNCYINILKDYRNSIKNYISEKTGRELKDESKQQYLTVAKKFMQELYRMEKISDVLIKDVKGFTKRGKPVHVRQGINDTEMNRLQDFLSSLPQNPQNARLKAMFALLIFQGLRLSEALNLDFEDIDLNKKVALVLRKGETSKRFIHLRGFTVDKLRTHIKENDIQTGAIFRSNARWIKGTKRLTPQGFRKIIKESFSKLDIENCPHGLRHYFATTLIKSGKVDIFHVMNELNHKNVNTTQIYFDEISSERTNQTCELVLSEKEF